MHSALDISDPRLHEFTQWLNTSEFTDAPKNKGEARVQIDSSIKLHDFSQDKLANYSGYGIKALEKIDAGSSIMKMATDMGFVSNVLGEDKPGEKEDEELLKSLFEHTDKVSNLFFPVEGQEIHRNRLNQHLLLTQ
jgi:hypothetical protein